MADIARGCRRKSERRKRQVLRVERAVLGAPRKRGLSRGGGAELKPQGCVLRSNIEKKKKRKKNVLKKSEKQEKRAVLQLVLPLLCSVHSAHSHQRTERTTRRTPRRCVARCFSSSWRLQPRR